MSGSPAPPAAAAAAGIAIKNDGSFMEQFKKLQAEKAKLSKSASPAPAQATGPQTPSMSVSSSPRIGSPAVGGKKDEKLSAIERRKAMEERMRNRGKRKPQAETGASGSTSKRKLNPEEEQDAYLREVRKAESKSLKDAGSGVRSLVK